MRILVVDDDQAVVEAITQRLDAAGHLVLTTGCATAVLRMVRLFMPDMIIYDPALRSKDCFSAIYDLLADRAVAHVPVALAAPKYEPTGTTELAALCFRDAHAPQVVCELMKGSFQSGSYSGSLIQDTLVNAARSLATG